MKTLHDDRVENPHAGDIVGETAGGLSGVVAGAAIGSAGGPLGTLIGGLAGAVGGWWAGREVSHAAAHLGHGAASVAREGRNDIEGHPGVNPDGTPNVISTQSPRQTSGDAGYGVTDSDLTAREAAWRNHYSSTGPADRPFASARPAYQAGALARENPEYRQRKFEEVEPDLRASWDSTLGKDYGSWERNREYARTAYEAHTPSYEEHIRELEVGGPGLPSER